MSHIVQIKTRVQDQGAVIAACRHLGLAEPVHGTAQLYSGAATGLLVQLSGWQYPAVIDLATGTIQYDNFEGRWGDQQQMSRFVQRYAVEKAKIEAKKRGHTISEEMLADGSIRVQIRESC
jgi:hypothetical protein